MGIQVAQVMTVISWCTYPAVYLFPMLGINAATAVVSIQIGYCVSDIISKCGVGLVITKSPTRSPRRRPCYHEERCAQNIWHYFEGGFCSVSILAFPFTVFSSRLGASPRLDFSFFRLFLRGHFIV